MGQRGRRQRFLLVDRWRDDDARDNEIDVKASKRRRASPAFEPRAKFPRPHSLSMSPPPMREPGMLRSVKHPVSPAVMPKADLMHSIFLSGSAHSAIQL